MPPLPALSGKEVVRAFETGGWRKDRQRGSHVILVKPRNNASLSVPLHREIAPGTLRALIRASGLSVDEFIALL